jgi:hypothetical protein
MEDSMGIWIAILLVIGWLAFMAHTKKYGGY